MKQILPTLIVAGLLLSLTPRIQAADPSPTPKPKRTHVLRDQNIADSSPSPTDSVKEKGEPVEEKTGAKIKSKPGEKGISRHRVIDGYSSEFYSGSRLDGEKGKRGGQEKIQAGGANTGTATSGANVAPANKAKKIGTGSTDCQQIRSELARAEHNLADRRATDEERERARARVKELRAQLAKCGH